MNDVSFFLLITKISHLDNVSMNTIATSHNQDPDKTSFGVDICVFR